MSDERGARRHPTSSTAGAAGTPSAPDAPAAPATPAPRDAPVERQVDLSEFITQGRVWRDGELVAELTSDADIAAHAADPQVLLWVDLLRPDQAALDELARRLGLDTTTIEDAVAPHERPKLTRHPGYLFFTVYTTRLAPAAERTERTERTQRTGRTGRTGRTEPAQRTGRTGEGRLRLGRLSGVVLPRALVTIRLDERVDLAGARSAWDDSCDLMEVGPAALVHGLLDAVVDEHFATIQQLDDELEELEDTLFAESQTGPAFARQVYGYRKDLVALRRVVLPMREVVGGLVRRREELGLAGSSEANRELDRWYDDLYDHALRAGEWTESLRDLVTSVFETNLSLQDARLNTVMKKLAGWAAIIAVPTAITGWFGQNVPYPGFSAPLGLWMSVVLIVVVSGALYALFKRRDWL